MFAPSNNAPNTVRETIAWLQRLNRPPLPECPIEAATQGKEPKAPCYLDGKYVRSISWKHWQHNQPPLETINTWFAHPKTGIGTLGGWNGKHWICGIDFDQKDFSSAEECDRSVETWVTQYPSLADAPMFRTPSGGYRFLVAFVREPENFKANSGFSLQPNGSHHVGELLTKNGSHTLLPPTIGVNGKAYEWVRWSEYPSIVEQPEDIGLYRVQKRTDVKPTTAPINRDAPKGNTTLSDFLTNTIYPNLTAECAYNGFDHDFKPDGEKLRGNCPWHESASGTAFYVDTKDGVHLFLCPACNIGGNPVSYRHRLAGGNGSPKGKDFVDIVRQLAADVGVEMPQQNDSRGTSGDRTNNVVDFPKPANNLPITTEELKQRIDVLIAEDPSPSDLQAKILDLATLANRQTRDVWGLYKARLFEVEKSDERETIKKTLPDLLGVKEQRLDPRAYLWGDGGALAKRIIDTANAMPTAPGFLMTTLVCTCGSSIGTAARIIVNPKGKYTQPSIYRTCIVAPSGFKKSPAQAAIIDPLDEMEAYEHEKWAERQKQYKEDRARYDRDVKANKRGENIGEPPEEPPTRKRYIVTNNTIEALIKCHVENPRGLLVYRDEYSGHITGRDKYRNGKGDDAENELSEFNGKSLSKDTVKETLYLAKTAFSRTGSTQPETLKRLMGNHEDHTGENARWLFCAEPCPPAYADLTSPSATEDTGLSQALRSLYEALHRLEPQDYFLSIEAKYVFEFYQHQLTDWTIAEQHPGLQTAYPKFESYFARLCLWLHIVNSVLAEETPQQLISDNTVLKASELTNYYIGQLRLIYAYNSPQEELKGRLLDIKQFIESKPDGTTPREIKANSWKLKKVSTSEIAQDCKTLESSKYIYLKGNRYYSVVSTTEDVGETSTDASYSPTPNNQGFKQSNSPNVGVVGVLLVNPQHHKPYIDKGVEEFVGVVGEDFLNSNFSQNTNVTNDTNEAPTQNPAVDVPLETHQQHQQIDVTPSLSGVAGVGETPTNTNKHQQLISDDDPDNDPNNDPDNDPDGGGNIPTQPTAPTDDGGAGDALTEDPAPPMPEATEDLEVTAPELVNPPHVVEWLDPELPNYQEQCLALAGAPIVALDIETYQTTAPKRNVKPKALHPWESQIRLIQLCTGEKTYLVDLGDRTTDLAESLTRHQPTIELLRQVIQNPDQKVIGHNIHFDLRFLATKLGIRNAKNVVCTRVGAQVFYGDYGKPEGQVTKGQHEPILVGGYSLANLAHRLLGVTLDKGSQKSDWGSELTAEQIGYAALDPAITLQVYHKLEAIYIDKLSPLYSEGLRDCWQLECDAIACAVEIELTGLPLDVEAAKEQLNTIETHRLTLLEEWSKLCPDLKYTQRDKLLTHLNKEHQLGLAKLDKGSLDKQARENPIIQIKLKLQGLDALANNLKGFLASAARDGRVHTTYKTLTGTGRFSSGGNASDLPNLQAIKAKSNPVLDDFNLPSVREVIRPQPGRTMAVIDLAGAHGRIAASETQDETAIAGNNDPNIDNHLKVAEFIAKSQGLDWTAEYMGKVRKDSSNPDSIKAKLFRDTAKNTYYGWLNGAGPGRIQEQITANTGNAPGLEECQAAIEGCKALYPRVLKHRKQLMEKLRINAINIDGRLCAVNTTRDNFRICMPLVPSKFTEGRLEPPYTQSIACIWSRIEATAVKRALVQIMALREQHPEWNLEIINYVHDEIDIEVDDNFASVAVPLVNDIIGDSFAALLDNVSDGRETDWGKLVVTSWADK